ncbi:MAG: SDR family oxidoreductase [Aestuariivita sp.]|nr:SDR family oxidoreductase [Aestuariivita sp.]MCY4203807.1 SDR family oxidoreductase [Aestuariivita sp.]MCY4288422.1 SDR family oxidoreductase [Aestuariivita sp.]MCY4345891.1 SDR family oxidoreductase [Aestuariivita sp.]
MLNQDLRGRRALVTGGASGIGLATVTMLAECNAKVAMNHLEDDPAGREQVARLTAEGVDVISAPGDVGDPNDAEAMAQRAITELGGLDYLVNNAGMSGTEMPIPPSNLDMIDEELWQTLLTTNLISVFRISKAAAPALKEANGAIVNTASTAGIGLQGSSTPYAASKSGVVSVTRSLARGLAPSVRVNAVAPGQVETRWTAGWPEKHKQAALDKSLIKRHVQPEDVAQVIIFLLIGASMITGQTIVIDGGMTVS